MKSITLSKTSAMKYHRVRQYLQNKTLAELNYLQGNSEIKSIHSQLNNHVLWSKTQPKRFENRQERKSNNLNQTQETIFDEDPSYSTTVEIMSPSIVRGNKKIYKRRKNKKVNELLNCESLSDKLRVTN